MGGGGGGGVLKIYFKQYNFLLVLKADTWNSYWLVRKFLFLGALNWCLQKKAGTKIHSLKAVAWTWNCLVFKILKVIVKKFELQRVLKYDIFQCFSSVFCLVGWGGGLGRKDRSGATPRLLHSRSYSPQVVVSGWLIENHSRRTQSDTIRLE